jgi:hypothetical protein
MLVNVLLDFLLSLIPGVGALITVFYRANNQNVKLLRRHLEESRKLGSIQR